MKYALISDIHANLPALEAVLSEIGTLDGITATYQLGDLVGYAPWPNEVVALLRGAGYRAWPRTTTRPSPPITSTVAAAMKIPIRKN
jgi:hypothetical protein